MSRSFGDILTMNPMLRTDRIESQVLLLDRLEQETFDYDYVKDQYEQEVMGMSEVIGFLGPTWTTLFNRLKRHEAFTEKFSHKHNILLLKTDFRQFLWHFK